MSMLAVATLLALVIVIPVAEATNGDEVATNGNGKEGHLKALQGWVPKLDPNPRPYVVNIMRKKTGVHICMGALYSEDVVVAPASCVNVTGGRIQREERPAVRIGNRYINGNKTTEKEDVRETVIQEIHPDFNGHETQGFANDIAVLFLNQTVKGYSTIKLGVGPCEGMESVAFYRRGQFDAPTPDLHHIEDMKQVDSAECEASLKRQVPKGMFCATSVPRTICEWDRGSLLLCPSEDRPYLVGLASHCSEDCGQFGRHLPYYYTNVAEYKEWIDSQISSVKSQQGRDTTEL